MCIFLYKLKDSYKAFAISDDKIIGPWINTHSRQKQIFRASITLFPLEVKSLVKRFCNINVRESPSISIVLPNMN